MDPNSGNPLIDSAGLAAREQILLAPYAMQSADSAGRKHAESPHPYRAPFQRDRDRIVHSAAYRRLSSKTQVFTDERGDYHRTRLTHTLEVASIARTIGRALRLNEDLVEALALAHDIGHPPYGHAGEDVLNECLQEEGGFSHNQQALRIVEQLEQRYPDFPGLNLSIEVLEGQATRIDHSAVGSQPLVEVQVVEAADSVTYDTHDADDAMELKVLTLEDLIKVPLWREALARVRRRYTSIEGPQLKRAILHELIDWQAGDLLVRAAKRIVELNLRSVAEARAAGPIITADPELHQKKVELEKFLREHVYRHPQLLALRSRAQEQLRALFDGYVAHPELLPSRFQDRIAEDGLPRAVVDYLAGMTDRYAQQEYNRLFA